MFQNRIFKTYWNLLSIKTQNHQKFVMKLKIAISVIKK